ncbi:Tyrosine recombinase XerC [Streptomyces alboniger]
MREDPERAVRTVRSPHRLSRSRTGSTTRPRSRTVCAPSHSTPRPASCGGSGKPRRTRSASSGPGRKRRSRAPGSGPTKNGQPLHPDWISRRFNRLVDLSGRPPIRLHYTRHLSATLALLGKADIKVVQERLGHSSRQITSDTYTSVLPQLMTAEAESTSACRTPGPRRRIRDSVRPPSRQRMRKPQRPARMPTAMVQSRDCSPPHDVRPQPGLNVMSPAAGLPRLI